MAAEVPITELLARWHAGDEAAAEEVFALVYDELRTIAERLFRHEGRGHTLQATAVVNEAYIRLVELRGVRWQSRVHFLGFAARVMRRVLVDYARYRNREKRGGGWHQVTLLEAEIPGRGPAPDVLALDEALESLAAIDPQKAAIVEVRFFGGLEIEEISTCFSISTATVNRQLRRARAWLYDALHG